MTENTVWSSTTPADRRLRLRKLIDRGRTVVLPGVTDALTARLVENAGFEVAYISGAGVANTALGLPDVGLLSFDTMLTQASRITAVTSIPFIVDGDTGYGGPTSTRNAIHHFEGAGVAGVQIEDQALPKRCGHFNGKTLVSTAEMQMKIAAIVEERTDPNFAIIARTDARAVEGFASAIRRVEAYREAGADVLFVEAPESDAEVRAVAERFRDYPTMLNIVEGGKTPAVELPAASEMGYTFLLHANFLMRTMMLAAQQGLAHLQQHGETASVADRYVTWEERQRVLGLPVLDSWEDDLEEHWNTKRRDDG